MFRQRELFNILISERGVIHRDIRNKGKIMREFYTGDLFIVRKKVKSSIKGGIFHKLLFKIKGPYRVLEKDTLGSYWLQHFPFFEVLGRPRKKVKDSASRMEKIPSTMVLHKHVGGEDNRFSTMSGPLVNNPLVKFIRGIIRGTYQETSEDIRWAYEPVSNFWPDIEPDSESSDDG